MCFAKAEQEKWTFRKVAEAVRQQVKENMEKDAETTDTTKTSKAAKTGTEPSVSLECGPRSSSSIVS